MGAILTQSTSWKNVEKAIDHLKMAKVFHPRAMRAIPVQRLERLIRSCGFFRQKAGRLKGFVSFLFKRYRGEVGILFSMPLGKLRKELLSLKGLGPETVDSILLYGGGKKSFVVDAYTLRIGHRAGLFSSDRYEEVREIFQRALPPSPKVYKEFHALLVCLAKSHCHKRNPLCLSCPLKEECLFARKSEG